MSEDTTGPSDLVGILLMLVVGVAMAGGGVYLHQDAKQATENAVEVDATVDSSTVESKLQDSDSGQRHRVYYVEIAYRYTYQGETYTSRNLCPGAGSSCDAAQNKDQRSDARELAEEYPEGETVTAYVQPSEPASAYLVDASSSSTTEYLLLVGIGGVIALGGVVGSVNGLRSMLGGGG
jgi:hypothetical protein